MKALLIISFFFILCFKANTGFAHEGHHHHDSSAVAASDSSMHQEMDEHHHVEETLPGFPNYHPLVVHFPIVLLLLAAIFQLFSFFFFKKELSFVTTVMLLLGVIGAGLSTYIFHAHAADLSGTAKEIFATHIRMASLTWKFSLGAFIAKAVSHFFLNRKWWLELIATLLMVFAATAVTIAGHHGAMLVHIEGVGPKGNLLKSEDDEHDDDSPKQTSVIYSCPMHPEVTSNQPGSCPKCGMDLKKQK